MMDLPIVYFSSTIYIQFHDHKERSYFACNKNYLKILPFFFIDFSSTNHYSDKVYRKNRVISIHKCPKIHFNRAYTVRQASVFMMEKNYRYLGKLPYLPYCMVRDPSRHINSRAFQSPPCSRMCRDFRRHRRFLRNHWDLSGPIHIGMLLVARRNHSRKF